MTGTSGRAVARPGGCTEGFLGSRSSATATESARSPTAAPVTDTSATAVANSGRFRNFQRCSRTPGSAPVRVASGTGRQSAALQEAKIMNTKGILFATLGALRPRRPGLAPTRSIAWLTEAHGHGRRRGPGSWPPAHTIVRLAPSFPSRRSGHTSPSGPEERCWKPTQTRTSTPASAAPATVTVGEQGRTYYRAVVQAFILFDNAGYTRVPPAIRPRHRTAGSGSLDERCDRELLRRRR